MAIPDGKPATDFSAMNREWVRAVAAEAAEAGGLPEVSGSDNGKVLTVVSGEWEAATPAASGIPAPANPSDGDVLTYSSTDSAWVAAAPGGGGGSVLLITNNNGTLNKTAKEISDALLAGTTCLVTKTTTDTDFTITEYGTIMFYEDVNHTELGTMYDFYVITAAQGSVISTVYVATSINGYPAAQH